MRYRQTIEVKVAGGKGTARVGYIELLQLIPGQKSVYGKMIRSEDILSFKGPQVWFDLDDAENLTGIEILHSWSYQPPGCKPAIRIRDSGVPNLHPSGYIELLESLVDEDISLSSVIHVNDYIDFRGPSIHYHLDRDDNLFGIAIEFLEDYEA